jgi:hypothetical protein
MNWNRIGDAAFDGLRAAWASRVDTRTPDPVLMITRASSTIAKDIAVLKLSRVAGDYIIALVPARYAARTLDIMFSYCGGDVRSADRQRGLVVYLSETKACVAYLDDLGCSPATSEASPTVEDPMAKTTQSPPPEAPPQAKPKRRKKKVPKRARFGDGKFAYQTRISTAESMQQIQSLLAKYQATQFGYVTDAETSIATISFRCRERLYRFQLTIPRMEEFAVHDHGGLPRKLAEKHTTARFERAMRSRFRALALGIRAKLVLVEAKISTLEESFLAESVDPHTGLTVAELIRERAILPQLSAAPRVVNGSSHVEAHA